MSNHENQETTGERLEDLPQPAEELTTGQAANVRGGWPPTGTRSAITVTGSNPALDSLLTSEVSVQKV